MARNGPSRAEVGVLLLNMGGPDQPAAIRPFLYNLFDDREIIHLPGGMIGQRLLGRLIVHARLKNARANYRAIGGGSPIVRWTTLQMEGLQRRLQQQAAAPPKVGMAMRYWHPFADEALRALEAAGVTHVIGLTLYPHLTAATTGSSERDLVAARDRLGLQASLSFIRSWYDHLTYLDLWARKVQDALDALAPDVRGRVRLIASAHGLPQRFVDRGDPYVDHVKATLHGVLQRLDDPPPAHLAFQSRTGPVKWIGPGTGEVIERLAEQGHDALLMWPISFVSDHVETTYEVNMLFRGVAERAGVREYHMVPAINDDPQLWDVLADLVTSHLSRLDEEPRR